MFVLIKDEEKFVLVPGKKFYTVGRLSTDLILKDDLSISRTHVRLHLPDAGSGEADDDLKIEDLGSKYGTFLNGDITKNKRMESKILLPLKAGATVRFGAMSSVWKVTQMRLVTTTSSLTRPQVVELNQLVQSLGGSVVQNWTDQCCYLTMNEASVTIKLLHALLSNTPIVTCAYWRDLLHTARRIHVTNGWPQPLDYQPTNMDVEWRPERATLFSGKTFVFMNRKHFEIYGSVVQKAGGSCKDLNSGVRKTFLTRKDVIVIQYVPSTQSQATETINSIQEILEQADLRIIQEYEIGMALINCSTKEFCNPAQKLVYDSMPTTESMTSSLAANSSIIVPNTEQAQGSTSNVNKVEEVMISDSDEDNDKPKSQPKRPSRIVPSSSQTTKRKRNHTQFIDSSDEDEAKPTSQLTRKRTKSDNSVNSSDKDKDVGKAKPSKSNNVMFVDSSDEDTDVHVPRPPKPKNVMFVDSSEDEEKVSVSPQETRHTRKSKANVPIVEVNIDKKKKVNPVSSRRSPRLLVATKQPEKTIPNVAENESDSDEENLFQFKITKNKELPPSKEKPVEPVSRISVCNFLEKSQNHQVESQPQQPATALKEPRKRLRLELLSESDSGNEDNLFNFADSKKQKLTKNDTNGDDSLDNGIFNFRSKPGLDQSSSKEIDQDLICTEPFKPNKMEGTKKSKYVVLQPMQKPRAVNISGWLSCGGLHDNIKSEANVSLDAKSPSDALEVKHDIKLEITLEEDQDTIDQKRKVAHLKWLASIKDSIQVQMCSLQITSRSHDTLDATDNDASVSKYSGRKNFKKFVKNTNLHPQQHILQMKRLQLADGMVSSL